MPTYISAVKKFFLIVLIALTRSAAAQAPGTIIGDVVTRETGAPLDHAMISLTSAGRQTFTNDAGRFAFAQLTPGNYRIRVAHLGFTPVDTSFVIPESGAAPRLKVALARLSVRLVAVKVLAKPSCTTLVRPDPVLQADFSAVVQQIRMNAEQYQLLSDSFPFTYSIQKARRQVRPDEHLGVAEYDTVHSRSDYRGWEYKVGEVVERERDGSYLMHLPTLRDFASIDFLNNHCFRYAGTETNADGTFLRIDFQVDDQIRTPDVNGSIFLDATTYQIRLADLQLSRMEPKVPNVTAVRVKTYFTEVAPSIVIFGRVVGTNSLKHGWGGWAIAGEMEEQRMIKFEWLGANPRNAAIIP